MQHTRFCLSRDVFMFIEPGLKEKLSETRLFRMFFFANLSNWFLASSLFGLFVCLVKVFLTKKFFQVYFYNNFCQICFFFRTLHQPSSYRTGSSWYTGTSSDRPLGSYTPGSYRSRFDDNFIYRRSAYDVERPSMLFPFI